MHQLFIQCFLLVRNDILRSSLSKDDFLSRRLNTSHELTIAPQLLNCSVSTATRTLYGNLRINALNRQRLNISFHDGRSIVKRFSVMHVLLNEEPAQQFSCKAGHSSQRAYAG